MNDNVKRALDVRWLSPEWGRVLQDRDEWKAVINA